MIELGYDFNKSQVNKIKKFKNRVFTLSKNNLNKNSKYQIFLSKNQFNNLLNASIRYKLTDNKKSKNIQQGDGIGNLIKMALPFMKSITPKVLGTVGLSSIGVSTSNTIHKSMNKDKIIKLDSNMVKKLNKHLDKINKSGIVNKKLL